jgi:autotransporter-associated beta strand protein
MASVGVAGIGARLPRRIVRVATLGKRQTRRRIVNALMLFAMLVQLTPWGNGSVSLAATDNFTGAADTSWDTNGNWSLGIKPGVGDDGLFPAVIPASGGTISLGSGETANTLSFGNNYILDGGDLMLTAGNVTVAPTFTAQINSVLLGAGGITLSANNGLSGGSAVLGGGTLVLTSANSYTGPNVIDAGTLAFRDYGALGTGDVTVNGGGTLENRVGAGTVNNNIFLNTGGTYSYTGTGQANIGSAANTGSSLFLNGDATVNNLNAGTAGKIFVNAGQLGSNAGVMLTKTGAGVMQLAGAMPNFQGKVTINGGYVEFQQVDALGMGVTDVTINNGGEIVASGASIRHNILLNAGGTISANGNGGATYAGPINVAGNANIALRLFQTPTTPNNMQIRGEISGPGNLTVSAPPSTTTQNGSLLLSGNNATYAATITANPYTQVRALTGAGQNALGSATIALNGGTLGITPTVTTQSNSGFNGQFYNSNNQVIANGVIGGFDFGLTTPVGTRMDDTIDVANAGTGFNNGVGGVQTVNMAALWTGVLDIGIAGAYTFTTQSDDGSMMYIDGQPVVLNDFSQGFTSRSGVIDLTSGAHSIIVKYANGGGGAGMRASYSGADTGSNAATIGSLGGVTNNGGTLFDPTTIANDINVAPGKSGIDLSATVLTSTGNITLATNATLAVTGQTGSESLQQQGNLSINGIGTIQTGIPQQLNGTPNASSGADLVLSNPIVDVAGNSYLIKDGPRSLKFTGDNFWTGNLLVAGGTVDFSGFSDSFKSLKFVNNTTAPFGNTPTVDSGSGTLTLVSDVYFTGNGSGASTIAGNLNLNGARNFNSSAATNANISATISNGVITKTGLGGLTLSGDNSSSYTSVINVNEGKLSVGSVNGLGDTLAGTIVNPGGTLEILNVTTAEPLTLAGSGSPVPLSTIATYGGPQYSGALLGGTGFASEASGLITLVGNDVGVGVAAGNMLTISGVISGAGGLSKTLGNNATLIKTSATTAGPGILKLTGSNTFTGPLTVRGGDVWLANSSGPALATTSVIIGDGTADAALTMVNNNQFADGTILTFAGGSKNAKFQLNGTTQTVAGFEVSGNTALIQNHENGAAGDGTLIIQNPLDTSFVGEIRDQNAKLNLVKQGAGTFTLSGDNPRQNAVGNYTGTTTINEGKYVIFDSTAFKSPTTINGGSLEFNNLFGRTVAVTGAITDNGFGFTKSGAGNMVLNTLSNVSGTVNVLDGVLNLTDATGNVNPMPNASINVAAGAQLQFQGVTLVSTVFNNNVTLNGLTPGGALAGAVISGTPDNTLSGTLTLAATSNVSTGWSDKTFRMTGKVTGPGGLQFDKMLYTQNPPVFQLTNTGNDYAGGTRINAGTVYFADGALPSSGLLTFGGFQTQSGLAGTYTGPNLVIGTGGLSSFSRSIGTGAGQVAFTDEGGGFSAVGGNKSITFGGTATPQSVDWGGAGFSSSATLWLNGSIALATGSTKNGTSELAITNDIALSSAGYRRLYVDSGSGRLSGVVSGAGGLLKDGPGNLILSGASGNTYTGLTNVTGGTLTLAKAGGDAIHGDLQISNNQGGTRRVVYLNASNQINDASVISFVGQNANNGDFRLLGFNETVAGLMDRSGGGVIEVVEAETATNTLAGQNAGGSVLTVNSSNDSFYNGFIRNRGTGTYAGTLGLTKDGSGTFTLSAGQQSGTTNQIYTGATTILNGTLRLANTESFNSAITVNAPGTIEFSPSITRTHTYGLVVSGNGNLVKTGLGTLVLSGANSYSGMTTVAAGTLSVTGAPTGTGAYTVNPGANLQIGSGAAGAIQDASNITDNGTVTFNRNNGYTYNGAISGTGGVTNIAAGPVVLAGANSYSGVTTVNSGALTVAGSGVSAGGLVLNGGTLGLDFTAANANQAGIVAASAPVTFAGGTLQLIGNVGSTQSLGAVTVNSGASTLDVSGDLALTTGAIIRNRGGVLNVSLPGGSTSVKTVGTTGVGGILGGYAVTTGATPSFVAIDGSGNLTPLTTFSTDNWNGGNVTVTSSSSQAPSAIANSLTFDAAGDNTVNLGGTGTITSGGILVTPNAGVSNNLITGGTLVGATAANGGELIVHQLNTQGTLTIASTIANNGASATGLTKAGAGTLIFTGSNTYTGNTTVAGGNLTIAGTGAALPSATVLGGATLQFGDGSGTDGAIATNILNRGTVLINNSNEQVVSTPINASPEFNYTTNATSSPTSFTLGTVTKSGAGTLTITSPILASQFHQRQGTTILDTGANVVVGSFNSLGLANGDTAIMTVKGAAHFTESGDFNVSDQDTSNGTLNIQDIAQLTIGSLFVGKSGSSIGQVNQTGGSVANAGGSNDWRIGGAATTGTGDSGAQGTYNLVAGTFQTGHNFQIGASGQGVFNQTGGTVSVTGGFNVIGRYAGGQGTLSISNGTYTNSSASRMIVGESGTGTLNMTGAGQLIFTGTAAGTGLGIGANTSGAGTGVVNLDGGLIQTSQVADQNTDPNVGSSTFNFNGGVLRVTSGTASAATFMQGLTQAVVKSGGAFIDTNGVNTTIAQPLLAPTEGDTSGGLTKLNTGTLTLASAATYGGATPINGGTLQLNLAAGTAPATDLIPATSGLVINGGGLLVSGKTTATSQTFASTTLNSTGAINATIGTGGSLTLALNAITRNNGSAVDFVLPASGAITTTTSNQSGTILGGWATASNGASWAVSASDGSNPGNITALATAGYTNDTWGFSTDTNVNANSNPGTDPTTNSLRFNVAGARTVTISGTGTINSGGILVTPTVAGNATTITGGTLTAPGDLIVHNYSTGTLTLTSILAQSGNLVKQGGGLVILNNAETYTGDTIIGGGTLRIAAANRIPDASNLVINAGASFDLNNVAETVGSLSGSGSVVNNVAGTPTLTVGSNGSSTTFSGLIVNGTGNVALTKIGAGTLTLNNVVAGSYTGNTTISDGAIDIATPQALANNTVVVVNSSNGLLFDTTVPVISALAGSGAISLNTQNTSAPVQLTIGNNNNGNTFSGLVSGPGTLIKTGNGTQTFSGQIANDGGVVVNGGNLILTGSNSGAASAPMLINSGSLLVASPDSFYGSFGRNVVIDNGGALVLGSMTANPAVNSGFSTITSALDRIDPNSTGVLALTSDGSLQTPITENIDLSASGPNGASNLSLGAGLNANQIVGNSTVRYQGIITPNGNTFRLGGGNGRLLLDNANTLAGANNLNIGGGGTQGGQLILNANFGFTGATTLNSGLAIVTSLPNGGVASPIGASSAAASNLVLNGGTLQYVGSGASTDRLFTLTNAQSTIDASGTGALNFTNTGAMGFVNSGNRTLVLQGNNTSTNTLAAAIGDSIGIPGANGVAAANGVTTLVKNGNGTWVLSGNNTFTGGITVNNGVVDFAGPGSVGGSMLSGVASVNVGGGGAAALGAGFNGQLQTGLNRISPLSTGTVALTGNTAENLNFDGGSTGANLPTASLGAYGNVTYTGTLTPFGNVYRLGGGGGVLTLPNGGLTGPRSLLIGGGGPGGNAINNANLNGVVVLGGTSDYNGGTQLLPGAILSATSPAALGVGPLKFQGGVYRVSSNSDDITLAADGVSAREIRIGTEASNNSQTANIDVPTGIDATFSKSFGTLPVLGANLGTEGFTKTGGGSLVLAAGPGYNGTTTIERGTLSFASNPNNYGANIQVGSNIGGVGTLKLVANDVFANGPKFGAASVVVLYNGSKLELNGFSDTFRQVRGMGSIVNSSATVANLTVGTNNELEVLGGSLVGNFNVNVAGNISNLFGTPTPNSLELWNDNNAQFTGKFAVNAGALRVRADGSLGSSTEAFKADKITLDNGAALLSSGNTPVVLGANHGITLGAGGGTLWQTSSTAMVVNSPITGPGRLIIADDSGVILLNSDNNTYTGGTQINSNAAARGMLVIGAGGATGSLPAGDVFFNSGNGLARLYFFKSTDMTLANNFTGPGLLMQVGSGTTTLTGNNVTNQLTQVGGGRLRADFTDPTRSPIGAGTPMQVAAGTFEYVAPAGDNVLRLGALTNTTLAAPTTAVYIGGTIGDGVVQSTYGGSGHQELNFASLGARSAGMTTSFVTSGGQNGVTNRISFLNGPAFNNVIGASYLYNGSDFAAYDQGGFVRAANYGVDANTAPINTLVGSRYSKLTTTLNNAGNISVSGINFSSSAASLNTDGVLTFNANPGAILKTGGGMSTVTGAGSIANNGQELIVRTDSATDVMQIDVPINGTGQLTKSGLGQLVLTAANGYTGNTILNSGEIRLTGNGTIGAENAANGSEMRIAQAAGSTAILTIDSPSAGFASGATNNGFRVGEMGNGIVNQSDGTLSAANFAVLGESMGSTGTYNISGGNFKVKTFNGAAPAGAPSLVIGRAGTGTLNVSGTANVQVMNGAQMLLGDGVFNTTGFQGLAPNAGIATGVGTVNQTGGTVTVANTNGSYQSNFFGAVILGVDGAGTYNLNGGTLATPILARGNGTANFNLGSGTLQATANTLNLDLAVNTTGTGANKGTIDTNGNDLTFTSPISGNGGLKKVGSGTLTMIGNSTYTGGTDINSGTVVASGSGLGNGAVNVNAGTTLNVQGAQQGLLARFFEASKTDVNPNVTTGSANMSPEFSSLDTFNAFVAGKAMVAAESTTARGKTTVDYLEAGAANGNTAIPPTILNLQNAGNPFIAHLSGKFNAPTSGEYTFSTRSDDGNVLWIDGQPVLDNNRSQGATTPRIGSINLSAGQHDITFGYYQGTGGSGFSVGVTIPGQGQTYTIGSEQQLPNSMLSYGNNLKVKSLNVPGGNVNLVNGMLQTLTVGDNTSVTNPITITSGGSVDLGRNGLAVDYAPSTSSGEAAVLASVRSQIIAGYGPGKNWGGANGITSSSAAGNSSTAIGYALASEVLPFNNGSSDTFLGSPVDKTTVVARYTLAGDATLDGTVDFNDLVKLAQNYNTTVSSGTESWWNHGDFTYDGVTDFNDLVKLAQNYNTSLPNPSAAPIPGASIAFEADLARAFSSVPEPGTLSLLGLGALALLGRRRNKKNAA